MTQPLHSSGSPLLLFIAAAVVVLPLLVFLVLAVGGKRLPNTVTGLAVGAVALSTVGAVFLFAQVWQQEPLHMQVRWLELQPGKLITAGIYLDNLAVLMLVLASFISLLVNIYSLGYMKGDPGFLRYFAFLSLFTGSMLAMVLAGNLLVMFVFWELVGFSSYLLIGFWRERAEAGLASMKAFLVNRVADLILIAGLLMVWAFFGTFELLELKQQLTQADLPVSMPVLTVLGMCLFAGFMAKSAQFPLQVWLPDAMAGPTPVSSLLHAATMVAAGVFLMARCYVFFTPDVLVIMTVIGSVTMVLGAVAALGQYDIKQVLAYSTISQLGYMVMGMGTGAYDAALLHLCIHAFFKAALFLLAGIIMHYVHHQHRHDAAHIDAQDMRNMGGLRKKMPLTFVLYLIAAAALVGLPMFSGFLSKDALIHAAWHWADKQAAAGYRIAYLVPDLALLTVLLTAWYVGRQVWLIFLRPAHASAGTAEQQLSGAGAEAPLLMRVPVLVLSVFCLGIFFSFNPFHASHSWLLDGLSKDYLSALSGIPGYQRDYIAGAPADPVYDLVVPLLTIGLALAGLAVAWRIGKRTQTRMANLELAAVAAPSRVQGVLAPLIFNVPLLDRLYQAALVRPLLRLSRGVYRADVGIINYSVDFTAKSFVVLAKLVNWSDRVLVDGVLRLLARLAGLVSLLARQLQSGRLQSYFVVALVGLVLLVALLLYALAPSTAY